MSPRSRNVAEIPGRARPGLAIVQKFEDLANQYGGYMANGQKNRAMLVRADRSVISFL
jgi:hypothetical protein